MGRRRARWFGAVGLAVVVVAMTPSTALAGGPTVTDAHDGYSFRLPSGWQQVALTKSRVSALLKEAAKLSPQVKSSLSSLLQEAASSHSVKVFAVGPLDPASSFLPNVNVIVTPAQDLPSGQAFVALAPATVHQELGSIGATGIVTKAGTLNSAPALLASYTLHEKTLTVHGVQLYVSRHHLIVNVTVSGPTAASARAEAGEIASSWRWR
ncbi:MAG TPA: hypothetical protein VK277_08695 [Acidimicrobiales bacterium]|nr:hypothetical protein [Acidimicrobiales bacterium]